MCIISHLKTKFIFFHREKEIEYSFSGKIHSMLLVMSTVTKKIGFVFNYIDFQMVGIQRNFICFSISVSVSKKKKKPKQEITDLLRDQNVSVTFVSS